MSSSMGPVTFLRRQDGQSASEDAPSEGAMLRIESEVETLLADASGRASAIPEAQRLALERLAARLLQDGTVDRETLVTLIADDCSTSPGKS